MPSVSDRKHVPVSARLHAVAAMIAQQDRTNIRAVVESALNLVVKTRGLEADVERLFPENSDIARADVLRLIEARLPSGSTEGTTEQIGERLGLSGASVQSLGTRLGFLALSERANTPPLIERIDTRPGYPARWRVNKP